MAPSDPAPPTAHAEGTPRRLDHSRRGGPGGSARQQRSVWLVRGFLRYCRWYVGRHFHTVRLSGDEPPAVGPQTPLVIYLNHPSWWDPLLCLLIADRYFPGRASFAPIAADMLERYRFFARLGFFGVEQGSQRGAGQFLRQATDILREPNTALWLTPEGRFTDVRARPVRFLPGLGHLPGRSAKALFLPLALELAFWEERTPEALLRFGEPMEPSALPEQDAGQWTALLEGRLAATLDALAASAQRRHAADFKLLLRGGAGVGGVYDLWRRARSWARGESFQAEHTRR